MLRIVSLLVAAFLATSGFWKDAGLLSAVWPTNASLWGGVTVFVLTGIQYGLAFVHGEGFGRERRSALVDLTFESTVKVLRTRDSQVRVGIMLCSWVRWWKVIPRRGLWFVKRIGFNREHRDFHLILLRHHGISGLVVATQQWAMGLRYPVEIAGQKAEHTQVLVQQGLYEGRFMDHGMSKKQQELVASRVIVFAYPIFAITRDENGTASPMGKIIGVVTVDSSELDAYLDPGTRLLTPHAKNLQVLLKEPAKAAGYIFG